MNMKYLANNFTTNKLTSFLTIAIRNITSIIRLNYTLSLVTFAEMRPLCLKLLLLVEDLLVLFENLFAV